MNQQLRKTITNPVKMRFWCPNQEEEYTEVVDPLAFLADPSLVKEEDLREFLKKLSVALKDEL